MDKNTLRRIYKSKKYQKNNFQKTRRHLTQLTQDAKLDKYTQIDTSTHTHRKTQKDINKHKPHTAAEK